MKTTTLPSRPLPTGGPHSEGPQDDAARPGSGAMFDRIAGRYDLLNRVMTFGLDHGWRRRTVAALELRAGSRVLDLATGTADMALEVLRQQPGARVIGLDPSTNMLAIGRDKVAARHLDERIELRAGVAEQLPFDDDSFDGLCIAYGIRNVPDRRRALAEMARVVRPGGRVAILEATEAQGGPLALGARIWVRQVVPRLGALLSKAPEYRYLQSSIAAFPAPAEFARWMEQAGLRILQRRAMTFGANTLFVAEPTEGGHR